MVFGGTGDDTFQWDPGDGNDTVEGEAGNDRMIFNGSAIAEILAFSANGPRLLFTRNVGNVVMDANGIERFDLQALGGADAITVNSLAGTNVTQVNVELAGTLGGATGDAQADVVTVNGTDLPDTFNVAANAGVVEVFGLAAQVRILHPEVASDNLTINGLGGVDIFNIGPGITTLIGLTTNQ